MLKNVKYLVTHICHCQIQNYNNDYTHRVHTRKDSSLMTELSGVCRNILYINSCSSLCTAYNLPETMSLLCKY